MKTVRRCLHCGSDVPRGKIKYCSDYCMKEHNQNKKRVQKKIAFPPVL